MANSRYERILLKVSGECFNTGHDINRLVNQIEDIHPLVPETAIVVGGGNILRGREAELLNIDRVRADWIGMLGTVISGLLLENYLDRRGILYAHLTALDLSGMVEPYTIPKAFNYLNEKRILILSAGTGSPFFSTDTAAALRASELKASVLLKGTKVDGVYSSDPQKDSKAKRYPKLSYSEAIAKNLKIMDATAFSLCWQEQIPIVVFNILEPGSLRRVVFGEDMGTVIC